MQSNKVELVTWLQRQITLGYCDWSEIWFRCHPNKSGANTTLTWMQSNKIKLVTWHSRQITLGYCDWSEISWITSFCANNPFPDMEIYFPFRWQPNKLYANTTPTWRLSNKIKLVTWHPREITIGYCDWSESSQKPAFCASSLSQALHI